MSFLSLLLILKIGATALSVSMPFLCFSLDRLSRLTGITAPSPTLFRLYGMAVTALLVGYASGFWTMAEGAFPWGVVVMGFVSNGGATLYLLISRSFPARLPAAILFGLITVGLGVALGLPDPVLRPLW